MKVCVAVCAMVGLFALFPNLPQDAGASPQLGAAAGLHSPPAGLLHEADTFHQCREMYFCGVGRDGRARCGPRLRCETCSYVRRCRKATGCVWEEKCSWGPYRAPIQQ